MCHDDYKKDPVFKNGLIFGDVTQINYVKKQTAILAEIEEKREAGLRLWKLDVCEERYYDMEVWAEFEDDAITEAHEIMERGNCYDGSFSYEIMDVIEVPE